MGGKASRDKGKRGEREAAKYLSDLLGSELRRAQQFAGGVDSADIVGLEGVHFEVKRVERLRIYEAVAQAVADSGDNCPVVMHRTNNKPWLLTVRVDDLPRLSEIIAAQCSTMSKGTGNCGGGTP
jgi:Holliday junction resolvase|tara:strand:+ start:124 stop:498 length:375 start_codon:yes stop_codon:yes gene_type:complete